MTGRMQYHSFQCMMLIDACARHQQSLSLPLSIHQTVHTFPGGVLSLLTTGRWQDLIEGSPDSNVNPSFEIHLQHKVEGMLRQQLI